MTLVVSVPLRGVDCYASNKELKALGMTVSVPLRGVDCYPLVMGEKE